MRSVAGAGTVVSSLWQVDDESTAYLFRNFYQQLRAGKGRGESLELAQKACRARFAHPYFWAGFTLLGNPR